MKTKANRHKFTVTVKTFGSRRSAHTALLSAFARRNPDGCEFKVKSSPEKPVVITHTAYAGGKP